MRGTTLMELVVVLLIVGLITGMSAVAVSSLHPPPTATQARMFAGARAAAARSGTGVTVAGPSGAVVLFRPDGRAIGNGVDPFTGELSDEPR